MGLLDLLGLGKPEIGPQQGLIPEQRRRTSREHVARFERAVLDCEAAIARGESTPARLAEHHRWLGYYRKLAALEEGRG